MTDRTMVGTLRRQIRTGLILGMLAVLATAMVHFRNLHDDAVEADWVARSLVVINALETLTHSVGDVAGGAIDYGFSGNEEFLQSYQAGRTAALHSLDVIRGLTAGDSNQQVRVGGLAQRVEERLEFSERVIEARRATGAAGDATQLAEDKRLTDPLRANIETMRRAEMKILDESSLRSIRARRTARWGTVFSLLTGLAFFLYAWVAASRAVHLLETRVPALEERATRGEAAQAALETAGTRLTAAEAQLRESEEQMRLLLDGAKEYAIYKLDAYGLVTSWNSNAAGLTGYGSAEILGKHYSLLYRDEDRTQGKPAAELLLAGTRGRYEQEGLRLRQSGEPFWVNAVATAAHDRSGNLSGFTQVIRDITARKEDEARLQKQAASIDLAHDAMIVFDLDYKVVMWNGGAARIYGWTAEEAVGRVIYELLQTQFPIPREDLKAALLEYGEWEGELRHHTRGGTKLTMASRWSLQRADSGAAVGILEINRDITDHQKAEADLRTLAAVVQNSQDFIGIFTPDLKSLFVNRAGMEMVGLATEDAVRQTRLPDYFWPEDRIQIETNAIPALARNGNWRGEVRFGHFKTGEPIPTLWDSFAIRDLAGQTVAWAAISPNLERMKMLRAAIGEKDSLLRERQARIVDSAMDAIITIDEGQTIVVFNAGAEKLFLCPAAEAIGQPVNRFIPTRFHAAHGAHVRAFGETGITNRAMGAMDGLWAVRSNGEEFEIEASISHLTVGGQKLFSVILRDISQRKAAEREIRRLNEELATMVNRRTAELEASNRELESFTYAVAHDLRAPLRQMAGFCGILLVDYGPTFVPEACGYLNRVQEAASRMGTLVDGLLKLGKVGRQAVRREEVDLNDAIEEVIALLEPEYAGRQVEWKIASFKPVHCDAILIRLVFQNLISNALKYSSKRPKTVIEIGQLDEPEKETYFVRDNGVGFDMKYSDKLFGVFQRLHDEADFTGTGVGLAIVQRIVLKHGGKVWAEAAPEQGATFLFTLDQAVEHQPEMEAMEVQSL